MRLERRRWDGDDADRLAAELRAFAPAPSAIAADVAAIVESVRAGGDRRLHELIAEHDGVRPRSLKVDPDRIEASLGAIEPGLLAALELVADNVRAVAEAQVGGGRAIVELPQGHSVEVLEVPVAAAGVYVPGGRAAYPSTALMGVIAARVAGVDRVVVASPPTPSGEPDAAVLAACSVAGADEVYAIGGAHAIAALALGTESVGAVDVVAGPGGPWVQEAKLAISRECGIDGYAGPSELVVVSDGSAPAGWLALDLRAQAEHGSDGLLVAIGTAPGALADLERALAQPSQGGGGSEAPLALVEAPDREAALALAEALAPEHLQLCFAGAAEAAPGVRTAGCVLVGAHGATAFADYAAGSNHVLPTGGAGRFSGPLGPGTFRRRTSVVRMSPRSAVELAPVVETLAGAEGFEIHGESALARTDRDRGGPRADEEE